MFMKFKLLSFQHMLRIMLICWAIMQLLCYPLWHGLRDFPLVPIWNQLLKLPWYLHDVFFYSGLGLMLLMVWKPNKKLGAVLLAMVFLNALLDQNRWMPWHYQFIWMLAAYVFLKNEKQVLQAWSIILVSVYFYSGLSKLQPSFIHDIWNYLLLQSWLGVHSNNQWFWRMGYLVPVAEMTLAILLLIPRFRKIAVGGLITMHFLILLWLGPLGLNINEVIWPWNLLMPLLLCGVFLKPVLHFEKSFFKHAFAMCLIWICCFMPLLHRFGYWDKYLSFPMYSGGVPQLYICTDDQALLMQYAPFMSNRRSRMFPCNFPIPVYSWAITTIKSAPNSEKRVFVSIAQQFKERHPGVEASFYIYYPGFRPSLELLQLK
jgi:hypothetical protein